MNEKGYIILRITEGTFDSGFGEIIIVKASPIVEMKIGTMVHRTYCSSDEETFCFPQVETIRKQIHLIANGGGEWHPDKEDFLPETAIDNNMREIPIYRHISFYGFEYDATLNSGQEICLIPDIRFKAKTMNNQYYQGGWFNTYTFREYVESLAEGDDVENFWGWLFNRPDLNGLMPWDLACDFEREYERFLDVCDAIDNKNY